MTSLPGTRPGAGRGWGVRLRAPSPESHLPGARRRLRLKSLRKREGGLEILFSFVPATGAGSRRPGWGPRDWGSPRSGEERNKGCAAPGSPSPRPNFARGARVPGEPARCAENPGVRAEPGLGGVRRRRFPPTTPGPQEGIPELPGGNGWPSRARRARCPRKLRGCPSLWLDDPALGVQGPTGRPLPPPSFQSRAKVRFCSSSPFLPPPSPPFSPLFTLL